MTIRRNCSQLFLFSLSRDQHYLKTLNSELFGGIKAKNNLVKIAYNSAQDDSKQEGTDYFYLWIDSSISVPLVCNNIYIYIYIMNQSIYSFL